MFGRNILSHKLSPSRDIIGVKSGIGHYWILIVKPPHDGTNDPTDIGSSTRKEDGHCKGIKRILKSQGKGSSREDVGLTRIESLRRIEKGQRIRKPAWKKNGGRGGYIRGEFGQHGGRRFGGNFKSNGGRSGA